ncbi:MAG: PhzF family phenazine biosynthesis protein [Elusimicrobia bacterium]|nr:PhzF family phenazine biosynthesis protein [Elusimicrobiota bacterium]MBK7545928.1 PhzF family phenazine biosynthesis protein [Elusimicrobiota bacterium]MBK7574804.1 PhzF family phenazine biosynthesis protein [Elusimicrobiota bacterium]MBK7687544.1 PhzF family phenazine biosynthesis protein [Elusimicrobiota bacterium]MBK9056951.1 PhzF family phenazine biosynthesis protein [Elusimicrobiota bacterium]
MELPYFIVDAFTDRVFGGNPAGVCPLTAWLPDETLARVAAENSLSETAFFVPAEGGYQLRWFAPGGEVTLCGHATMAAAYVLWEKLGVAGPQVFFQTQSGPLSVYRSSGWTVLDLPAFPLTETLSVPDDLVEGLWARPTEVYRAMDYVAVFSEEEKVRDLTPRLELLKRIETRGVIATAPGKQADYVCRFFAPRLGIPEDPATGSAQCVLAPYWAKKLGKTSLRVRQLSPRGAEMYCEVAGDRVRVAGHAALYLEGRIHVPDAPASSK